MSAFYCIPDIFPQAPNAQPNIWRSTTPYGIFCVQRGMTTTQIEPTFNHTLSCQRPPQNPLPRLRKSPLNRFLGRTCTPRTCFQSIRSRERGSKVVPHHRVQTWLHGIAIAVAVRTLMVDGKSESGVPRGRVYSTHRGWSPTFRISSFSGPIHNRMQGAPQRLLALSSPRANDVEDLMRNRRQALSPALPTTYETREVPNLNFRPQKLAQGVR